MKSSLLLVSGASIAAALPKVDIVVETDIVYYTVTQEVTTVQTVPAKNPPAPNVNLVVTPTTSTIIPVVTVTIDADELAPALATSSTSSISSTSSASTSVKAATSSAPAATPSDLASTAVYHHNIHRTNNSAPAMTWGSTYAGYAATVAASCKFAHDL